MLEIRSTAFNPEELIPKKYTCQGEDVNPELTIHGIPEETKSLVLIMDDPDAPSGTWDHWVVWNIDPVLKIAEDSIPKGGVVGKNSWDRNDYGGPCPPSGTHRYFFKLYALDTQLALDEEKSNKKNVENAMKGHIIEQAVLMGKYKKL
jgi:Raf kinase inhibitor-like YbhB/YbcL family protein